MSKHENIIIRQTGWIELERNVNAVLHDLDIRGHRIVSITQHPYTERFGFLTSIIYELGNKIPVLNCKDGTYTLGAISFLTLEQIENLRKVLPQMGMRIYTNDDGEYVIAREPE